MQTDGTEVHPIRFPDQGQSDREDIVTLLKSPSVLSSSVSHQGWRKHGTVSALDAYAVQQILSDDVIEFRLEMTDEESFLEAESYDRSLEMVAALSTGSASLHIGQATLDIHNGAPTALATLRADAFITATAPLGQYRLGLVPQSEVNSSSTPVELASLVSGDAPTLLIVDSSSLNLTPIQSTPSRVPISQGFTNHIPVQIDASSFGIELESTMHMISGALVSKNVDSYPPG